MTGEVFGHPAVLDFPNPAATFADALNRWLWHFSCAGCRCQPAKGH